MKIVNKKMALFFSLLLLVVLVACNKQTAGEKGETKELIFALDQTQNDTWVRATQKFAEIVEDKTNGTVKVSVHHSGTLGSQREVLEGMLNETMDGTVTLEPLSYWVEDVNIYGIPYLFRDQEHLDKFLQGDQGAELHQKFIEKGFRPLTYFKRPPRLITSNKPINSLADLAGLTIRVPETATAPPAFKALGAAPTAMAFSEVYNSLDQGVIDAQENPLPTIYANNLHEVQDYIAYTNHQYQVGYFVISEETYQSFTEEERQAVEEAALEMNEYEAKILEEDMESIINNLTEAGVTFTEPDVSEFAEAAKQAYSGYDPLMQEWIEKIQSIQ